MILSYCAHLTAGPRVSLPKSRPPDFRQGKWPEAAARRIQRSKQWQKHRPRPHVKGDGDLRPESVVEGERGMIREAWASGARLQKQDLARADANFPAEVHS